MANTTPPGRRAQRAAGAHLWLLASHDFRQPVQSLAMIAAELARPCDEAARQDAAARVALVAASLSEAVDTLSLIAEHEAQAVRAAATATMLDRVVGPVLAELAALTQRQRREFEFAELGVAVAADAGLLHAAVRGLLLHAIRFANRPAIRVAARRLRTGGALDVVYDGPDPGKSIAERALIEFSPLASKPAKPIVGLGLALVARAAELCSGNLAVGQTPDGRRRLRLTLPLAR